MIEVEVDEQKDKEDQVMQLAGKRSRWEWLKLYESNRQPG